MTKLDQEIPFTITPEQIRQFDENGFLIIENFYDIESVVDPLVKRIYRFFKEVIMTYNLQIDVPPYSRENFDLVYYSILIKDRGVASIIYDAIKQFPEFLRIVSCKRGALLAETLCGSKSIGIAGGGFGIR